MNSVIITGKVVSSLESKLVKDGSLQVVGFTLEIAPIKEGGLPGFAGVVLFGETARAALEQIKEGGYVLLEGAARMNVVQAPEGFKDTQVELNCRKFQIVPGSVSVNTVVIVGRCGRDPEFRTLETLNQLAKATIAVDRPAKDNNPDWFSIEAWAKTAQVIVDYVKKGSLIGVIGSLKWDYWDDRGTGAKRSKPIVKVEGLRLLGGRDAQQGHSGGTAVQEVGAVKQSASPVAAVANYDEIPF